MIEGIERYYFLFGLALIWIVFATFQDLKKREVANWLNFSLVGFALAYRAFFSAYSSDFMFFVYGLMGFALFFLLANLFYYSKMFAGGDAKLLMGIGAVLPIGSWIDLMYVGIGFIFLMLVVGAGYSIIYSIFLVVGNWKTFRGEFAVNIGKMKFVWMAAVLIAVICILLGIFDGMLFRYYLLMALFAILLSFLFVYLKSLDKCMIKLVSPFKLTEGDWLEQNVKVRGKWIKKSVHGLSLEDIAILRRAGKRVLIKEGIPFVPAILASFLIMVFFFAVSELGISEALFALLS